MLLVIKVSNLPNSDLYRSNGPTLERQIQDLKSSRAELMKSAAAVREREREGERKHTKTPISQYLMHLWLTHPVVDHRRKAIFKNNTERKPVEHHEHLLSSRVCCHTASAVSELLKEVYPPKMWLRFNEHAWSKLQSLKLSKINQVAKTDFWCESLWTEWRRAWAIRKSAIYACSVSLSMCSLSDHSIDLDR